MKEGVELKDKKCVQLCSNLTYYRLKNEVRSKKDIFSTKKEATFLSSSSNAKMVRNDKKFSTDHNVVLFEDLETKAGREKY